MKSFINLMALLKIGLYLMHITVGILCLLNNINLVTYLHPNILTFMIGLDSFKKLKKIKIKSLPVHKKEK